jgi:hypothetical protein
MVEGRSPEHIEQNMPSQKNEIKKSSLKKKDNYTRNTNIDPNFLNGGEIISDTNSRGNSVRLPRSKG